MEIDWTLLLHNLFECRISVSTTSARIAITHGDWRATGKIRSCNAQANCRIEFFGLSNYINEICIEGLTLDCQQSHSLREDLIINCIIDIPIEEIVCMTTIFVPILSHSTRSNRMVLRVCIGKCFHVICVISALNIKFCSISGLSGRLACYFISEQWARSKWGTLPDCLLPALAMAIYANWSNGQNIITRIHGICKNIDNKMRYKSARCDRVAGYAVTLKVKSSAQSPKGSIEMRVQTINGWNFKRIKKQCFTLFESEWIPVTRMNFTIWKNNFSLFAFVPVCQENALKRTDG